MFALTAFQVVLAAAIIMGLSALVTILLRLCTASRFARRNEQTTPDEFARIGGGLRLSLTSLQQRVMTKLRDRPPRYETRHNYEYRKRDGNSQRIAVLNPAAAAASVVDDPVLAGPPPSYDTNDTNSVSFAQF